MLPLFRNTSLWVLLFVLVCLVVSAEAAPIKKTKQPPSEVVQLLLKSYRGDTDVEALSAALENNRQAKIVPVITNETLVSEQIQLLELQK